MFGLLGSKPFDDGQLGRLERKGGYWRSSVTLGAHPGVPLLVAGGAKAPSADLLVMARSASAWWDQSRSALQAALFEHYEPYGEEVAVTLTAPESVWAHLQPVHVLAERGVLEIGLQTDWDEEHTLGALLRDGRLIELNGSVPGA